MALAFRGGGEGSWQGLQDSRMCGASLLARVRAHIRHHRDHDGEGGVRREQGQQHEVVSPEGQEDAGQAPET